MCMHLILTPYPTSASRSLPVVHQRPTPGASIRLGRGAGRRAVEELNSPQGRDPKQPHASHLLELQDLVLLVSSGGSELGAAVPHGEIGIAVLDEVLPPRLVLLFEPVLALVLDKEKGEYDADKPAARGDDECVSLAEVVCCQYDLCGRVVTHSG